MKTKIFIEKAKQVHGDKYDYSKVEYINCSTKVCIICPIHGEFWQEPSSHLRGCSCRRCSLEQKSNKQRLTIEQFIERSNKLYNNKYDYSKVEYIDYTTKVCIICPIHGEFWQTPASHLKGGCSQCSFEQMGKNKTLSTELFIKKSNKIHNNKYDYTKTIYKGNRYSVIVTCPTHGDFSINSANHLQGRGCKLCAFEKISKDRTKTLDEFIAQAKLVHGDKYDYSKVEYVDSYSKVCIICPIHGEFWQTPASHLKGGCKECSKITQSLNRTKTLDEFIAQAKLVHGDKYDYSKVEYKNSNEKICIICPIHGEFWQIPSSHISNASGCPKCANNQRYSKEEFIETAKLVHGDKYDYSKVEYKNNYTKVCIICDKTDKNGIQHGEFFTTPHTHLKGSQCPKCKFYSKLEEEVRKILKENNINYIEQKTFEGLKHINNLKIDFYLLDYNIAIECQGLQHFAPINFGGNIDKEKMFETNILRDKIKKDFCEKNNIRLLYYTHEKIKDKKLIKTKERLINEIKKYDSTCNSQN